MTLFYAALFVFVVCSLQTEEEWKEWQKEHKKIYSDKHEENYRKLQWMRNYKQVKEHNGNATKSYLLVLNMFADMTYAEYCQTKLTSSISMHTEDSEHSYHESESNGWYPEEIDWRNFGFVTRVKSQGNQCKSSWAFSAIAALEAQYRKIWGHLVSLSEQQLIDCSGTNGNKGCTGGTVQYAFDYIQKRGGICAESSYSYLGYESHCVSRFCRKITTCTGYVNIALGNEDDLQDAVFRVGPVSVSIDASDHNFRFYRSGVYCSQKCSTTDLNHSLLLVGYGTDGNQEYWILKNSWGTSWGQNGYMLMARNQNNTCGIASSASYPTVVFT